MAAENTTATVSSPSGTEPRLTQHRISAAFPRMPDDQFRDLVEDIKAHGLRDPITIYEDEVLDGSHRYRACQEAGVPLRTVEFTGTAEEAVAFVLSKNKHRRHLDTGQLALFTVEHLLPQFEAEARKRERAGKKDPGVPGTQGPAKAAAAAGKVTGVSASSVKRAKFVKTHGTPEDVEAVRTGKVPLKRVTAQVHARRTSSAASTVTTSAPTLTSNDDSNNDSIGTPIMADSTLTAVKLHDTSDTSNDDSIGTPIMGDSTLTTVKLHDMSDIPTADSTSSTDSTLTTAPSTRSAIAIASTADPMDVARRRARRMLVYVLDVAREDLRCDAPAAEFERSLGTILDGFRAATAWEDRRHIFERVLTKHIHRAKKIRKRNWHTPAGV